MKNVIMAGRGNDTLKHLKNYNTKKCKISIISQEKQILSSFDYDMEQIINKVLYDNGVSILLNTDKFSSELASKFILISPDSQRDEVIHQNIFGVNIASVGKTSEHLKKENIEISHVKIVSGDNSGPNPSFEIIQLKVIYDKKTYRILGAQIISEGEVEERILAIKNIIDNNGTLRELSEYDIYNSDEKDIINAAGYMGMNAVDNRIHTFDIVGLRELVKNGATILDVRENYEFEAGHIEGSINLPLNEIVVRIKEIPKDRPIYIYCRSAHRSHDACVFLSGIGYKNVYNMEGGFINISYYEYFNDKVKNRKSILTAYNFE